MRERSSGIWAFAVALSAAPLSYLMAAPCGLLCGACPLGGACLIASPLVFGMVIMIKSIRGIRWFFGDLAARITGRDRPSRPRTVPPGLVQIEDGED
jgi:hypothetical protein